MECRKVISRLLCCLVTILVLATNSYAADSEQSRKTLTSVKGVYVLVEELQPNLQRYLKKQELSRGQLQTQIENQLKTAGIKVLTRQEWLLTKGRPVLYVNVNTHEYQKYRFAYGVSVELQQIVSPEVAPDARILATTWSVDMTGAINGGSIEAINQRIKGLIDLFINAFCPVHSK